MTTGSCKRRVANSDILRALETTVHLFAWPVLPGVYYGVKKRIHIGVDALIASVPVGERGPV